MSVFARSLAFSHAAAAHLVAAAGWRADVVLKTDGAGWILDRFSLQLQDALRGRLRVQVSPVVPFGWRRPIVHFIGGECFYDASWQSRSHRSKTMIGLWWHGSEQSPESTIHDAALRIPEVSRSLSRVHVTCAISRNIVKRLGVSDDRIVLVPMGVDLKLFYPPPSPSARADARRQLGLPVDALIIGSFQKDGSGWGDGEVAKRVKGPDVFAEVAGRLNDRHPVFALIPGPARGFLKRQLEVRGVPYRSDGFVPFRSLRLYYYACDMYLMTGREEGGPAAVLEAPACGVPFVGHRSGMAPDVLSDGKTAFLSSVDDVDDLVAKTDRLFSSESLRHEIANAALSAIQPYSWLRVAEQYRQLYETVAQE